ncbi:hypothetical protein [Methanospirillum sp.]
MNVGAEREIAVLDAVQAVYKKKGGGGEVVISRTDIINEILENSKTYGIRVYNINELRKMVTTVCCEHFEERSANWRSGAWLVTGVDE